MTTLYPKAYYITGNNICFVSYTSDGFKPLKSDAIVKVWYTYIPDNVTTIDNTVIDEKDLILPLMRYELSILFDPKSNLEQYNLYQRELRNKRKELSKKYSKNELTLYMV